MLRQVDPARLEGEALRRWYLRSPEDIENERRAADAQRYSAFFSPALVEDPGEPVLDHSLAGSGDGAQLIWIGSKSRQQILGGLSTSAESEVETRRPVRHLMNVGLGIRLHMSLPVDTSTFQLGVLPDEDAEEEKALLDILAERARAFVESHRWAPPIADLLLAFGIGGVIGLFLVRFERGIITGEGRGDTEIWVVVGDLPSIYFETENIETRADALTVYCNLAEDWADRVLSGGDLSDCFPIPVEPTEEHAKMLKSRIATIRADFVPLVD